MSNDPRIVLLDIETIPDLDAALRVWPGLGNFPGRTLRATVTSVVCFGYKILGEGDGHCISAWDFPEWKENVNDDRPLLEEMLKVLDGAHGVVTHNGIGFDWRHMQTRLLKNKLDALPPIWHTDTNKIAKAELFAFSNSLAHLLENFTTRKKLDHEGWPLWVKVHGGTRPRVRDEDAERRMAEYCIHDVLGLEALFTEFRKFSKHLPNHNLFDVAQGGKPVCPNCGSTHLVSEGVRATSTMIYKRYCCRGCGKWCRTDARDRMPRSI